MKIVLAGAYGNLGADIFKALLKEGHEVVAADMMERDLGLEGNFTFKKIAPFSVSGIVWYQGESDTSVPEGSVYDIELCELIKVWRRDLRDEDLPFIVIQIADYDERNDEGWRLVQEAQLRVQNMLPHVKTVVCRDICESDNIHPPTKDGLSLRIVNALGEYL